METLFEKKENIVYLHSQTTITTWIGSSVG